MTITRIFLSAGAAALAYAIFWAMEADGRDLFTVLGAMFADPWTVVTFIDLYLGFLIAALIIVVAERRLMVGLVWAIPIFFLGNVWTALWLIIRLPSLVARLRART